jgi:hypothetical protein
VTACRNEPVLARLLEDGHYRQRIAQVQVDVEVLKRMVEQVVDDLVGGQPIGGRGSLSKLHWSEAHQRFAALAHEMVEQAPYPPSPEVAAAQRRSASCTCKRGRRRSTPAPPRSSSASSPTGS